MGNKRKPNPVLEKYYIEQGSCCCYCGNGVLFTNITRDHIVPKSKGGTLRNNSVFACKKCNSCKGSSTIEEFYSLIMRRLVMKLRKIVKNKFKASQSDVDTFRNDHRMLMNVAKIIGR